MISEKNSVIDWYPNNESKVASAALSLKGGGKGLLLSSLKGKNIANKASWNYSLTFHQYSAFGSAHRSSSLFFAIPRSRAHELGPPSTALVARLAYQSLAVMCPWPPIQRTRSPGGSTERPIFFTVWAISGRCRPYSSGLPRKLPLSKIWKARVFQAGMTGHLVVFGFRCWVNQMISASLVSLLGSCTTRGSPAVTKNVHHASSVPHGTSHPNDAAIPMCISRNQLLYGTERVRVTTGLCVLCRVICTRKSGWLMGVEAYLCFV